ncbi:MAG: DnaJ domain-containing protein [Alphaproteobacteria bacterium]|nr:DnaJ domain-containing protein [Alphaproteobacteria bacterium]
MRDPYAVLGVDRRADTDTIRKRYRKLAKEYHPDLNKDPKAEERFKEINAAYDIVGDEDKRKAWDEFGEASTRPGFNAEQARAWRSTGGGFGFGGGGPGAGGVDVEDLLGSLFGGGGGGRGRRGQDQQVEIRVDFMTTVLGGERQVSLRRPDGTTEPVRVPIPAGARDGGKVRLKGQGLPPRGGGPCGDLIVILDVPDHPLLRREGDDLEMDVPITVLEALQGAAVTVPTPTGDVKVTVPAGARSGARLRIKGRGVQKRGTPGDLYLVLRPTVPPSTDPEVIAAAERMEAAYTEDIRGALKL